MTKAWAERRRGESDNRRTGKKRRGMKWGIEIDRLIGVGMETKTSGAGR